MIKIENCEFLENASLKDFCTFKIGGCAKYLFIVHTTDALIEVCKKCACVNIKYKVIGLGANLLFSDFGYNGAIIVNRSKNIEFCKNIAVADSGTHVTTLIQKCLQKNLSGIENLAGIPSTVGGAVVNSLGAFDTNFSDFVETVECFDLAENKAFTLNHKDCNFGYRTSLFKKQNYLITRVKLKFLQVDKEETKLKMMSALTKKKSTQPLEHPSAGSIFKRSDIIPAQIIDRLGLKGLKIGGAEISKKHAGFIINTDNATARDVLTLIEIIKEQVYTAYHKTLETEIEIIT
ncbi:MAG: UDP-N-acetylmuramate dehydrogenase [Clostridia bacterium]|nr:UDP-N-acetylmuramate dehydrogenase [Clostridia bacterium]